MGLTHIALAFKSTVFVLLAFAIVLLFRVAFMEWSGDFTLPFLRTGRIGELAFLFVMGSIITIVMMKLLMYEFRAETRPKRRKVRRLRR